MRILFLGDVVGKSGCDAIEKYLPKILKDNLIDFSIVNGENSADEGVGITKKISDIFLRMGLMLLLLEIMYGIKKK